MEDDTNVGTKPYKVCQHICKNKIKRNHYIVYCLCKHEMSFTFVHTSIAHNITLCYEGVIHPVT